MEVIYEQKLIDYMNDKGFVSIVFEHVGAIGCCADSAELYSRFAKQPETDRLKKAGTWRVVDAPVGQLLLARGISAKDTVRIGLKNFLGIKDIVTKDISVFEMR